MTDWKALGFGTDLTRKLREIGLSVALILLRWLLERLASNPAEKK